MAILVVARHVPINFDQALSEREKTAREAATRLLSNLAHLGEQKNATRLVITSPTDRTVHTATVFADVLNATLKQDHSFGEDRNEQDPQVVRGIKTYENELRSGDHTIVFITHQPLVRVIFGRVSQWLNSDSGGVYPPSLHFGINAINLQTGELLFFGKAASSF